MANENEKKTTQYYDQEKARQSYEQRMQRIIAEALAKREGDKYKRPASKPDDWDESTGKFNSPVASFTGYFGDDYKVSRLGELMVSPYYMEVDEMDLQDGDIGVTMADDPLGLGDSPTNAFQYFTGKGKPFYVGVENGGYKTQDRPRGNMRFYRLGNFGNFEKDNKQIIKDRLAKQKDYEQNAPLKSKVVTVEVDEVKPEPIKNQTAEWLSKLPKRK